MNRFRRIAVHLTMIGAGTLVALGNAFSFAQKTESGRAQSLFSQWDKNGDQFLSRDEFPSHLAKGLFDRVDANGDGKISLAEDQLYRKNRDRRPRTNQGPKVPEHVRVETDVVYETVGQRKLPLDLYLPKSSTPVPLVIWVHGGAWKSGSKRGIGPAMESLKRGYAVASVEYRLSGEAIFPAAVEDCKAAVSFLRLNAAKYNLDPDRFAAWGSSAGGHLVAMLGTTGDIKDFDTHPITKRAPSNVQVVCNWFGPTDFLRMNDFPGRIDHDSPDSPESRFIGKPIQEHPSLSQRANPITYVSPADPPMLLQHGTKDAMVPFNQSELLHAALTKAGVRSVLEKVVDGNHGFGGAKRTRQQIATRAVDFLDEVLGHPAPKDDGQKTE